MANHGYVRTKTTLDKARVHQITLDVIKKHKLTSLKLERNEEGTEWILFVDNNNAVHFWIDDEKEYGQEIEGKWVDYPKPKIISKNSVIEFRHGHGWDIMWWMEHPFMYAFIQEFGGAAYDDGIGEEPYEIHDETFPEYLDRVFVKKAEKKETTPSLKKYFLGKKKIFKTMELPFLPKKLVKDLQLDKI